MTDFSKFINFFYYMHPATFDVLEHHKLDFDGGYLSAFSKTVADFDFNHVLPLGDAKTQDVLFAAENEFKIYNREPIAYVTPLCLDYYEKPNSDLKLVSVDAWMLFDNKKFKTNTEKSDIKVRIATTSDMDNYIKVMNEGFSDSIYSDMDSGYSIVSQKSFNDPYTTRLMAFYKEKPVGVVCLTIKDNMAYIESFTVLKQYRYGGETARVLGNATLDTCCAKGAQDIFLITAAGSVLERFYKAGGFSTIFYGYFYKKVQP